MTTRIRLGSNVLAVKLLLALPTDAAAHVAEQGFVLLLPTGIYSAAGVAVVALTVLALFAVPATVVGRMFEARRFGSPKLETARTVTSLLSLVVLFLLLYVGLNGPRDPLSNLMPLMFWTVGWIGLVTLAGIVGNLWRWINPWTGLHRLIARQPAPLGLPEALGVWPAIMLLTLFTAFLLADVAPDDPARLAYLVGGYWFVTMAGLVLFGAAWLRQVEFGSVLMASYAALAPIRLRREGGIGTPGWRLLARSRQRAAGIFALALLAVGSFDGLNETFWWLAWIGVNPLEFPGRSAVIWPTVAGLAATIVVLILVFALFVWLGLMMARIRANMFETIDRLALSMLPIAFAYHIAHYLTAFLVNVQYAVAAISDPFATGADLLGLQPFYVTTGFFNHMDSVRLIWITQAGVVVIGHVWSVMLAHRIALDITPDPRRAGLFTLPLSLLMIAYTMFGLWLLAAPRGA